MVKAEQRNRQILNSWGVLQYKLNLVTNLVKKSAKSLESGKSADNVNKTAEKLRHILTGEFLILFQAGAPVFEVQGPPCLTLDLSKTYPEAPYGLSNQ